MAAILASITTRSAPARSSSTSELGSAELLSRARWSAETVEAFFLFVADNAVCHGLGDALIPPSSSARSSSWSLA